MKINDCVDTGPVPTDVNRKDCLEGGRKRQDYVYEKGEYSSTWQKALIETCKSGNPQKVYLCYDIEMYANTCTKMHKSAHNNEKVYSFMLLL